METIDKDLDPREKWAGIRELKTPYKPIPYAQRRKDGTKIKIVDRAESAVIRTQKIAQNTNVIAILNVTFNANINNMCKY